MGALVRFDERPIADLDPVVTAIRVPGGIIWLHFMFALLSERRFICGLDCAASLNAYCVT